MCAANMYTPSPLSKLKFRAVVRTHSMRTWTCAGMDMDGRTDGRTDGRMDGWLAGWQASMFLCICVCVCGTASVHSANSNQHPPQDKPGVQGWDRAQRKHACASWQGGPAINTYALPNLEPHELVRPATRARADESTRAGIRARWRDILASEATQEPQEGSSRTDPSLQY